MQTMTPKQIRKIVTNKYGAEAESKTQQEKLGKQITEYSKWSGSATGLEGLNPSQIKILEKSPHTWIC
ncbi:hypothetical protein [Weissella viridescens]|uniref:hypothetical protein n=1 Tax=Weissella viridescens TaxID=1629 RepID=UPI003AF24495